MNTKQSDIHIVISRIKQLAEVYNACNNDLSRSHIVLALSAEAASLDLKVSQIKQRWEQYLPFMEAADVDFEKEGKCIEDIKETLFGRNRLILSGAFSPSYMYHADMIELYLKAQSQSEEEKYKPDYNNLESYLTFVREIQSTCEDHICPDSMDRVIAGHLVSIHKKLPYLDDETTTKFRDSLLWPAGPNPGVEETCEKILIQLSKTLKNVKGVFKQASDSALEMLAKRFIAMYANEAKDNVDEDYNKCRISRSGNSFVEYARNRFDELKEGWMSNKFYNEIKDIININNPTEISYINIGRFILNQRFKHTTTIDKSIPARKEDIQLIIQDCFSIILWYRETLQLSHQTNNCEISSGLDSSSISHNDTSFLDSDNKTKDSSTKTLEDCIRNEYSRNKTKIVLNLLGCINPILASSTKDRTKRAMKYVNVWLIHFCLDHLPMTEKKLSGLLGISKSSFSSYKPDGKRPSSSLHFAANEITEIKKEILPEEA